jgi:tetratricopeptide (TPR) repeat protein
MGTALLVEFYNELPRRGGENPEAWGKRLKSATEAYRKQVAERYTEGTLIRLLDSGDDKARKAALLALGLLGTMEANEPVAGRLHDADADVRRMAVDTLWSLWFRADGEAHAKELQRLARMRDRDKAMAGIDRLIEKSLHFAEAYNQRAILAFRKKHYERSVADCEKVLELNPVHFGAQVGMAQCYLQMRKHKAALKAFRGALRIHPHIEGVADTIRALEDALGEEGRKDDKK